MIINLLVVAHMIHSGLPPAQQRSDLESAQFQLQIIARAGFTYETGRAYVRFMNRANRSEEALRTAKTWLTPQNSPGADVTYADALAFAGRYAEARSRLKNLGVVETTNLDAKAYFDEVRSKIVKRVWRLYLYIEKRDVDQLALLGRDTKIGNWFAVPQNSLNQRLISLKMNGVTRTDSKVDAYGNKILLLKPDMDKKIEVWADVELTPFSLRELFNKVKEESVENVGYLKPSKDIESDAPPFTQFAASISQLPYLQKIEAVMSHMNKSLKYLFNNGKGSSSYVGELTALDTYKFGGGVCEPLARAGAAYLRAAGIPARLIRGYGAIVGKEGAMSDHTIVQYYVPGIGWADWDHPITPFESLTIYCRLGAYEHHDDFRGPIYYFQGIEHSGDGAGGDGVPRHIPGFKLISESLDELTPEAECYK